MEHRLKSGELPRRLSARSGEREGERARGANKERLANGLSAINLNISHQFCHLIAPKLPLFAGLLRPLHHRTNDGNRMEIKIAD